MNWLGSHSDGGVRELPGKSDCNVINNIKSKKRGIVKCNWNLVGSGKKTVKAKWLKRLCLGLQLLSALSAVKRVTLFLKNYRCLQNDYTFWSTVT